MKNQLRLPGTMGRPKIRTEAELRASKAKRDRRFRDRRKRQLRALKSVYRFAEAMFIDLPNGQLKENLRKRLEAVRKLDREIADDDRTRKGGKT